MSEQQDEREVISEVEDTENSKTKKILKNTKLRAILKNFGCFLVGIFVGLMIWVN